MDLYSRNHARKPFIQDNMNFFFFLLIMLWKLLPMSHNFSNVIYQIFGFAIFAQCNCWIFFQLLKCKYFFLIECFFVINTVIS